MARVEPRYAAALLAAAKTPAAQDEVGAVVGEYAKAMAKNPDLMRFATSPVVTAQEKKETLFKLSSPPPTGLAASFLGLLANKGRLGLLPGIFAEYQKQKAAQRGILTIHVSSSMILTPEQTEKIKAHYAALYSAQKVQVKTHIIPQLLGGVRVQIGDKLYDGTVLGRLEGLRREILGR